MSRRSSAAAACIAVVSLLLVAGAGPAAAATRAKCPRGTLPVLKGSGAKAKVVRKGRRLSCKRPAKLGRSAFTRPAASPASQLTATADQLTQALAVNPAAFGRISRRVGAARTRALTRLALGSWRTRSARAGAASAIAHAADDGIHLSETFGGDKGVSGSVKLDAGSVTDGGRLGLQATGSLEVGVTAEGLKDLAPGALPPGTSGRVKLDLAFNDAPAACPNASGKVAGKLSGSVKATITISGPSGTESQFASAALDVSYELTVGEDARWHTIDKVDAQSAFAFGGSKKGTETWRGRRLGTGFGQQGIFSPGADFSKSFSEQTSHFDTTSGGIFGPHTSVKWSTGPTAWDIQSISNLKGMIATSIATDYLTLAAVEYIRGIAAPRLEQHWYDEEACLKLDGTPAAAKLRAGETTKVTAKNAKAADGTPVKTSLTASGVASFTPGSATMSAGATFDFTLTAPNETPTHASWKVVALSRAGKKTVDGTLGDQPGYDIALDDHETGTFATHSGAGRLVSKLHLDPVAQSDPAAWTASAPLTWSELTAQPSPDLAANCALINPVTGGAWTVHATQTGPDEITVKLDFTTDTRVLWTMHCEFPSPPDPPNIVNTDGLLGVNVVALKPVTFTVPVTGGSIPIAGEVVDGTDGLRSSGTITVTPAG